MKLSESQTKFLKALKSIKRKMTKLGYNSGRGAICDELVREGVPSKSLWRTARVLERKGYITFVQFPDFTEIRLNDSKKCSGCNKPIRTNVLRQCPSCASSLKGL